jgi:DNA-3-methyladenine glycosylase I
MSAYHDAEWGVPEFDSRKLWETLMLEGFQAGLSWEIILRKRSAFRKAFAEFDPRVVAEFGPDDVTRLMENAGIVRAQLKIQATIRGAQIFNKLQSSDQQFSALCWSYVGGNPIKGTGSATVTELSKRISRDFKQLGFKFVGPTIVYAWMQAVGIIDDHSARCFRNTSPAFQQG